MWAAVVGNIVSFSFKQNYTSKTYFWLSYNIKISGALNYFLLDIKKGINGQIEIICFFLNLVYDIDFYEKWARRERLYDNNYIIISVFFCLVFEVLR